MPCEGNKVNAFDVNAESCVLFSVMGDAGHAVGQMMKSAISFPPGSISASCSLVLEIL